MAGSLNLKTLKHSLNAINCIHGDKAIHVATKAKLDHLLDDNLA
jgi:hypothetical protein